MANINQIKIILEDIQKDLATKATNEKIDLLVNELKAKDERINELETKVLSLESRLAILTNTNLLIERKLDDNEQYGRRLNLRINGIPVGNDEHEDGDKCLRKVKEEVNKLNLNCDQLRFDRAHRLGKIKKDVNGKILPRPMIVRLISWSDRTSIYRARNKDKGQVKFYIDLTKRRFELKKLAIERVKDRHDVDFIFADVNCNLCARFKDGAFKFFNSVEELDKILGH